MTAATYDPIAVARHNLTQADTALAAAKTDRERRMIRTTIAQIEAFLDDKGADE